MRTRTTGVVFPSVRLRWRPRRGPRPAAAQSPQSAPKPPPQTFPVPATCYRSGTDRALLIQPRNLPADRSKWPTLFRQLWAALPGPHKPQICLVERTAISKHRPLGIHLHGHDFAIDYTCISPAQTQNGTIVGSQWAAMSAAIGPYAYNARLLKPWVYGRGDGRLAVTLRNTNTGKCVDSTFDVVEGQAATQVDDDLDSKHPYVHRVRLDLARRHLSGPARILRTTRHTDTVFANSIKYDVTCVDVPRPVVFVRADAVGVDGTILPHVLVKQPKLVEKLERLRRVAAVAMGLAPNKDAVAPFAPSLGIVTMSSTHPVLSGEKVTTSQVDIVVRFFTNSSLKRTLSSKEIDAVALAAEIPGTVVEQLLPLDRRADGKITVGHQSGTTTVDTAETVKSVPRRQSATVTRSAVCEWEGSPQEDKTHVTSPLSSSLPAHLRHSLGMAFLEESRGKSASYLHPDKPSKHISRTERRLRRRGRRAEDKLAKLRVYGQQRLESRRLKSAHGKWSVSFVAPGLVIPPMGKFRRLRAQRRAFRDKAREEQLETLNKAREAAQEKPLSGIEHRRLTLESRLETRRWLKIKDASDLPKKELPSQINPGDLIRQNVRAVAPTHPPRKPPSESPKTLSRKELAYHNVRNEKAHHRKIEYWLNKHKIATTQIKKIVYEIEKVQYQLKHNVHMQGPPPWSTPKVPQTFFLNRRLKNLEKQHKNRIQKVEKAQEMCDRLEMKIGELRGVGKMLGREEFGTSRHVPRRYGDA